MNIELANAIHISKLNEIKDLCLGVLEKDLGGMSLYISQDDRRTAGWMLKGKKDIAMEILKILDVECTDQSS